MEKPALSSKGLLLNHSQWVPHVSFNIEHILLTCIVLELYVKRVLLVSKLR